MKLESQAIIVTGGASGIGHRASLALAAVEGEIADRVAPVPT